MIRRGRRVWAAWVVGLTVALAVSSARAVEDRPSASPPATRIISLAPFLTELLFDAGAGAHVVGVSRFSNYPEAARHLPIVGDAVRLDLERIAALHPDLVLAWGSGTPATAIERVRALHLRVVVLDPRRLSDIAVALRMLGRLAGTSEVAERAARDFEARIAALRARYASARPVPSFIEIASQPLLTLNDRHLVSDVLRLCGGRNVFGALPLLVTNVGWEDVLRVDPAAVFITSEDAKAALAVWRRYPTLQAVARGHVFVLQPDTIVQQTPRVLQGAETMCRALDAVRRDAR